MLHPQIIERIFGQISKVQILRFLVASDLELSGREIAKAARLSHVKAHTALRELNQHGVVLMRVVGRSILYRLNLNNMIVKKIIVPIFEKEARLTTIIGDILAKHLKQPAPVSVILFGSFATGHAKPDSDIDLLIIVSKKITVNVIKKALDKAEAEITIGFGNHLSPLFMAKEDFRTRFIKHDKLVQNIVKEGKILFGQSINELIKSND